MSRTHTTPRRQILVDSQVQGALLWRVVLYWFCFLLSLSLLQTCWIVLSRQASTSGELFRVLWQQSGPALLASCLLLPILMLDCVRLTNRFAGPIVRFRRHLRQIAAGEATAPMELREDDFWHSLADDFNAAFVHKQQVVVAEVQEIPNSSPAVPIVPISNVSSPIENIQAH